MKKVVIVDYGMGNLRSVEKKFKALNCEVLISSRHEDILNAAKLVLPGVGHFNTAVEKLQESGLWNVLNKKVLVDKTNILGICLGMQLFCKHSEEGDTKGFGWINADCKKLSPMDPKRFKIPQMGWNTAKVQQENKLFEGISQLAEYYFVHSYHVSCKDPNNILAVTNYGEHFVSAIQENNIYGVQFHPEKSQEDGVKLLSNFIHL